MQTKLDTHSATLSSGSPRIPILVDGAPFVGHLFEFAKDPLAFMRKAVAYGEPVVDFKVPGERISLPTSAEMSHQILVKHYNDFRKAERDVGVMAHVLGNGLVTNNDYNSHKKQRKLAQPGFHFRRIQGYAQTMIDYTEAYAKDWKAASVRDVNDDMFKLTLFIVSKTLFDSDMETMSEVSEEIGGHIHELQHIMNKGFQSMFVMPSWMPMPGQKKLKHTKKRLIEIMQQMIASRTLPNGEFQSGDDLLSMLLEARYEDGTSMPKELLMEELITLLSAGHETTSNTLTWALYLLAMNPSIQDKLFDEVNTVCGSNKLKFEQLDQLEYCEQVVKEAMRIYPAVWTLNTRRANKDVVIDGYLFEKDKHVFVSTYTNHHNPEYFPEPHVFDPDRFTKENETKLPRYAYMPFGGGQRVCIGNTFAMMESKVILAMLIQTFRFSPCSETKLELQPHVTLSNKDGMKLNVERR